MSAYTGIISSDWIEEAIEKNELSLVFQPQSCLVTSRIFGMEALVRWNSPRLGLVDTASFVSILERSDLRLVKKFHEWIVRSVVIQIARWHEMDIDTPVYINFSTRYLQCRDSVLFIHCLLQEYDISPTSLGVEVTETSPITAMDDLQYVLLRLSNLGIKIALDDFCTSYCSLEYLSDLPVNMIKLDKRFIHGLVDKSLERSTSMTTIVESLIDMAHNLGIRVVAEGVETLQQLEMVTLLGCDIYQGYLLSHPVPAAIATLMMSDFYFPTQDPPNLIDLLQAA